MNLLILAAGTRNSIIRYFKKSFAGVGNIVAADASNLAPAIYEADQYYIVPPITAPGYIDIILDICRKEDIKGVLSLIDPELSLLAANHKRFEEIGATVIGSSYEMCEMALNKMYMCEWLRAHGYQCADSWVWKEDFYSAVEEGKASYPVFVKPYCGSASIGISKAYDKETVEFLYSHEQNLMIQEYLSGQEIGADVYVDLISGEVGTSVSLRIRKHDSDTEKKISLMRAQIDEVTVQSAFKSIMAMGFPRMALRPTTTACLPASGML